MSGQFITFPLAHKRGFLKEEGIEAEIIRVTGEAGSAALSSGDLDYGTGMAVGGAMTGLPVKVVACFVPAPVLALVARPEVKSIQYIRGNRDGTIQFIMEWLKVNKEVAAATYDGVAKVYNEDPSVCEKGLRVTIEERKQALKINRDVPLSEVADLSLIREALRELQK